ncbi:MAG: hypothetical protein ACI9XC_002518 [Gammaproteobacteria bacterium]|jgi:hypothetical protein
MVKSPGITYRKKLQKREVFERFIGKLMEVIGVL